MGFSPVPHRLISAVAFASLLGLCSSAFAASQVDTLAAEASGVEARARSLELDTYPLGHLNEIDAIVRYQDHLFQFLVGEFEPAAEGFFALVTTASLTDTGLHSDAEWYLAESLRGMGNYATAVSRYKVMAEDSNNPFYPDSTIRLLEMYTKLGDEQSFQELYKSKIVSGSVPANGYINYELAKVLHLRGDSKEALSLLSRVSDVDLYASRAQYYQAVIFVEQGKLNDALVLFKSISERSVDSPEDRAVLDLSLLAQGRIHYEEKRWREATDAYSRIAGDSEYQAEQLYEMTWIAVQQEQWDQATSLAEIFLLGYPDHRDAGKMRAVLGQLQVRQERWDEAQVAYQSVSADFSPIRDRFAALAESKGESKDQLLSILSFLEGEDTGEFPSFTYEMMSEDRELSSSLGILRDLNQQSLDIDESESMVQDLKSALLVDGTFGSFETLRYRSLNLLAEVAQKRLRLIEVEEATHTAEGRSMSDISTRRKEIERKLSQIGGSLGDFKVSLEAHEREVSNLRQQASSLRRDAGDVATEMAELRMALRGKDDIANQMVVIELQENEVVLAESREQLKSIEEKVAEMKVPDVMAAVSPSGNNFLVLFTEISTLEKDISKRRKDGRKGEFPLITAVHRSLQQTQVRVDSLMGRLDAAQRSDVGRLKQTFEKEIIEVATQRTDYESTLTDAERVGLALAREGFGRMQDHFNEIVLRADVGLIDVFWAQKKLIVEEAGSLRKERQVLLSELDRRFKLIRQKINE